MLIFKTANGRAIISILNKTLYSMEKKEKLSYTPDKLRAIKVVLMILWLIAESI